MLCVGRDVTTRTRKLDVEADEQLDTVSERRVLSCQKPCIRIRTSRVERVGRDSSGWLREQKIGFRLRRGNLRLWRAALVACIERGRREKRGRYMLSRR